MISLINFRSEACVDWVELVVSPSRQTNWQTVQGAIFQVTGKAVHVRVIDRGFTFDKYAHDERDEWVKNSPAFKFRLQDTSRFIDVVRVITQMKKQLKCEITTTITGIEVAFDIYGSNAETAAAMYQGLKNPVSDNQRIYRRGKKRGDFTKAAEKQTTAALVAHLQAGGMIGIGNETDDFYQRIYFKTTDINGGVNTIQVEPRARIEIRIQGKELQSCTLEQFRQFKFSKLSKYFLFRNAHGADKKLNRLAGDAIQRLSRSWPTVGKYNKSTKKKVTNSRHCLEGMQQQICNAKTTQNQDSEWKQLQPNALALGAHCGESLITCGLGSTNPQEATKASLGIQYAISEADVHLSQDDEERIKAIDAHYEVQMVKIEKAFKDEIKKSQPQLPTI